MDGGGVEYVHDEKAKPDDRYRLGSDRVTVRVKVKSGRNMNSRVGPEFEVG